MLNLLKNNNDLQLVLDENNKILDLQNKVKLMNITKNVDRDKDEIKSTRLKINCAYGIDMYCIIK